MLVAKEFRFEAAHRIPWHEGACRHLHGHSYVLTVTLEGDPDERGMVIDFRHIKALLSEVLERMDHSVLVAEDDHPLIDAVQALGGKLCVLPFDSTAENLCRFIAERLLQETAGTLARHRIAAVHVRVRETETCYAELTVPIGVPAGNGAPAVENPLAV